jgi:iron(III) transport system permease protein
VLMIIMIVSIVLIQFLVGKRQLGRRAELQRAAAPLAAE